MCALLDSREVEPVSECEKRTSRPLQHCFIYTTFNFCADCSSDCGTVATNSCK